VATRRRDVADVDVIGYRRVSKNEQAVDWKTSLQDQTRAILELAARLGLFLLEELFFEDRFSGEDAESRPGFMALVAYCRANPRPKRAPGFVLFLNDSRFGRFRDPDEAAYWRFELSKVGWTVRFVENDDTDNLTTRHVLRSVGGAQASQYLANLKENAKRGARGAARNGLWQNEAPFGYRRLATAPGREPVVLEPGQRKADDQQVRLTPDPEEARLVLWMYETYAAGLHSASALARAMREKAPRLKWSKQNVAKMLANRTYLGEVIWCRIPHDKHERRERRVRPRNEWVVTENAHPPLVPLELFEQVQARLALNKRRTRSAAVGGYPLSGLIRCTFCGKPYVGGGGRRNPDPNGDPDRYRFYRCAGTTESSRICPEPGGMVTRRIIEPLVIEAVAEIVSDPQVQVMIAEEIDRYLAELHGDADGDMSGLRKEHEGLLRERDNLVGAVARGVLRDEEAAEELERIRTGLERTEARLARQEALRSAAVDIQREKDHLVALAADFSERAKTFSGPALRELIEPWLQDATFDKKTRLLTLTVRRVPRASSPTGDAEDLRGHGVVRALKVPRVARDSQAGRWPRRKAATA
jgi:site-specific DNA recombinase